MLRATDEKKEVQYNLTAQKIFSNIQTFMGEKVPEKGLIGGVEACATEIMKLGYKNEELRDEIYVQVLKQILCHPKLERAIVGWQLLGLVCEAFPPSPLLAPHVFHVMYPNTKPDVPVAPYAKYCMFTLWVCAVCVLCVVCCVLCSLSLSLSLSRCSAPLLPSYHLPLSALPCIYRLTPSSPVLPSSPLLSEHSE